MARRRFLEAGRLNSPRGLRGEIKFTCYCDSPDFLSGVKALYLDPEGKKALLINEYRPNIPSVIFEGYTDRESAAMLMGRTVYFDREDIILPEGVVYNDDLLGLPVYDTADGGQIGKVEQIEEGLAGDYYIVAGPDGRRLTVPAADAFIEKIDPESGISINIPEGLEWE